MKARAFGLILGVCVFALVSGCDDSGQSKVRQASDDAWELVKGHLRSPSSAQIVNTSRWDLNEYKASAFEFEFDAQNGFGAMIRNKAFVFVFVNPAGKIQLDSEVVMADQWVDEKIFCTMAVAKHEGLHDLVHRPKAGQ